VSHGRLARPQRDLHRRSRSSAKASQRRRGRLLARARARPRAPHLDRPAREGAAREDPTHDGGGRIRTSEGGAFAFRDPAGLRPAVTIAKRSEVGEGGFEPPKAEPTGLQPVPFGHSGTPPGERKCSEALPVTSASAKPSWPFSPTVWIAVAVTPARRRPAPGSGAPLHDRVLARGFATAPARTTLSATISVPGRESRSAVGRLGLERDQAAPAGGPRAGRPRRSPRARAPAARAARSGSGRPRPTWTGSVAPSGSAKAGQLRVDEREAAWISMTFSHAPSSSAAATSI
jgi:hypothetical protein